MAGEFIVALHSKLSPNINTQTVWTQFVKTCLGILHKYSQNSARVLRTLNLLDQFLDSKQETRESLTGDMITCAVKSSAEYGYTRFYLYGNQTLGRLRRLVGEFYHKNPQSVAMVTSTHRYDYFDDHIPLKVLQEIVANVEFNVRPSEANPK